MRASLRALLGAALLGATLGNLLNLSVRRVYPSCVVYVCFGLLRLLHLSRCMFVCCVLSLIGGAVGEDA